VLCHPRIHLWCRVIEWKNYSATLTKSGTIQVIDAANGLSETLGLHGSRGVVTSSPLQSCETGW
jgi:hypothetical protein